MFEKLKKSARRSASHGPESHPLFPSVHHQAPQDGARRTVADQVSEPAEVLRDSYGRFVVGAHDPQVSSLPRVGNPLLQFLGDRLAEWLSVKAPATRARGGAEPNLRAPAPTARGVGPKREPVWSYRPRSEGPIAELTVSRLNTPVYLDPIENAAGGLHAPPRALHKQLSSWIGIATLVIAAVGSLAWISISRAQLPSGTTTLRLPPISAGPSGQRSLAVGLPVESKKLSEQSADDFYSHGGVLFDQGRYDDAIAAYDRAIARRPDFAQAFNDRASAHASQGRDDRAIADYGRAIALKPDFADALVNRGITYARKGKFDNAIADFDRAISLKPDFAEAFLRRGQAYSQQQRFAAAIRSYDHAIGINPHYAEAILARGRDRISSGDEAGAEDVERAMTLDPWLQ